MDDDHSMKTRVRKIILLWISNVMFFLYYIDYKEHCKQKADITKGFKMLCTSLTWSNEVGNK